MNITELFKTVQEQISVRLKYGPEFIGDLDKIEVGLSDRSLVARNNSHSLYLYKGQKEQNKPLLLIYSLINRPYIFDLRPNRSLIEFLCNQGFDVYLIDWGYPAEEAALLTLEDFVAGSIDRFVNIIKRKHAIDKVDILGYCMGATFAVLYAGYKPESVNKMILLTPPLGKDEGGLLQKIATKIDWRGKISHSGVISGRFLKNVFNAIKPVSAIKKERDFWSNYDKESFLEHFYPVEKWGNDTPDIPGQVFFQFLDICFSKDELKKNVLKLGNTTIDTRKVDCPVLSVAAQHDWIIPSSSLETVKKVMPNSKSENYLLPGGHIGLVIGRTASTLWNKMIEFLNEPIQTDNVENEVLEKQETLEEKKD